MSADVLQQVYEQYIKPLTAQERLRLLEIIARDLVADVGGKPHEKRRWAEIAGAASYPLCGEDAQQWVSRGRREADKARGKNVGKNLDDL